MKIVRALLFYIVITGFTKKITMYQVTAFHKGGNQFTISFGNLKECFQRLSSLREDNRGYVGASIQRIGSPKKLIANRFLDKGLPYINSLVSWY